MSGIRSAMSSIPQENWERAFGKKEEKDEFKTVGYVDMRAMQPKGYVIEMKEDSNAENS
jgi:hypothetical protein